MRVRPILIACCAIVVAACQTDVSAPESLDRVLPTPAFAMGEVNPDDPCQVPEPLPGTIPWRQPAPLLESYCMTWWVIQGEDQLVSVRFAGDAGSNAPWFLRLWVPEDAQFFDALGQPVTPGTPVAITVAIHRSLYAVRFGPHGAGFRGARPAVLKLNYSWADLGKKDAKDLQVYYQPDLSGDWAPETTIVDKKGNYLTTYLRHFSNYAVAW